MTWGWTNCGIIFSACPSGRVDTFLGRFGKPGRSNHSRKGATYSPPRRRKLHIPRPAASGRSRSFRCGSSPHKVSDFAGTPCRRWYPSRWSGSLRSHESPAGAFSEGPTMPRAAWSGSWLRCLRASHRIVPPRNDTANCVCAAPRRIFFVAPKKQTAFRCGGDEGRLERYGFLPFGGKDCHTRHRSYCLRRGGVHELLASLQRL